MRDIPEETISQKVGQLVLHVGLAKSGTTYVQSLLSKSRNELRELGWVYPRGGRNQQIACYGICGSHNPWKPKHDPAELKRKANSLIREIISANKKNQSIIISSESLSSLSEEGIRSFVSIIGNPTKVIFTVRRMRKIIPSAWQQYLKKGSRESLSDFIDRLHQTRGSIDIGPWRAYAYGECVRRWSNACSARIEVVDVQQSYETYDGLWRIFCRVAGLPPLSEAGMVASKLNSSLSWETAEALRRFNAIEKKLSPMVLTPYLRQRLLGNFLLPISRTGLGHNITVPEYYVPLLDRWDEEEWSTLEKHSHRIHS